ncbi:hypothetical protein OG21DRAFT_1494936 [Imleria badia]|nr:hypothetical protein OG21DRAFT_1494936 [Imleria badia]
MSDIYPCTLAGCGMVFSKAFELKKHRVTHEDPDRVFYCPECNFITLQRKNLAIHVAIHTGEKIHHCPHTINLVDSFESPAREERCDYRTNDPAALTKHRKKAHGYIPPPNRTRATKDAPARPRKPRQTKSGKVSRRDLPYQHPLPVSFPKPSCPETLNSATGHTFTSAASPENPAPFLWQGVVDAFGQSMDPHSSNLSGYDMSTSAMLAAPEEEMDLNSLYDPSLQPEWMAKYEMSYSMFGMTGTEYLPQPVPAAPPSELATRDVQTGREGCLCPEWMVEVGIEGWDQSVLDTQRRLYAFDA